MLDKRCPNCGHHTCDCTWPEMAKAAEDRRAKERERRFYEELERMEKEGAK